MICKVRTDKSPEAVRKCIERAMTRNADDCVFFCAVKMDGAEVVTGPRREIHRADGLDEYIFVTVYRDAWTRYETYAADICRRQSVAMGRG